MRYEAEHKVVLDDTSIGWSSGGFLKFAAVKADSCVVFDFWSDVKGRNMRFTREHLEKLLATMKECEEEDKNRPPEDNTRYSGWPE